MFPTVHGVVSQGGKAEPGPPPAPNPSSAGHDAGATSHAVPLPGGSGGLLVVFARCGGTTQEWNTPTGWTKLTSVEQGGGQLAVFYRVADGTEPENLLFTTTTGAGSALIAYRVENAALGPGGYIAGEGAANINPPELTPPWGEADCIWFACGSSRRSNTTFISAPTNYSDVVLISSPTSSNNTNYATIATATRRLTASSEDPGAFSWTGTSQLHTVTVAVRMAAP